MPNVPLDTRFVGFAPETNLQERKSANINALSQPYTMAAIANAAPQIEIILDNGGLYSSDIKATVESKYSLFNDIFQCAYFWNIRIDISADGVNIPSESYFAGIYIAPSNSDIRNLSIPNLIECRGALECRNNSDLTTVNIGEIGTVKSLSNILLGENDLSVETVNYILALLVSLDGNNNTQFWDSSVELNGGTNAAPTGQGLIDKQTLIDRGADVETN